MKPTNDLDINRAVRRVLVKHWIDLGRISVRSTLGVVNISGTLQQLPGTHDQLTGKTIETILCEINRHHSVNSLMPRFDNWSYMDGAWHPCSACSDVARGAAEPTPGATA